MNENQKMKLLIFVIPVLLTAGCQKNSFESCVEFQTAAATRAHHKFERSHKDLQETVDLFVTMHCNKAQ